MSVNITTQEVTLNDVLTKLTELQMAVASLAASSERQADAFEDLSDKLNDLEISANYGPGFSVES